MDKLEFSSFEVAWELLRNDHGLIEKNLNEIYNKAYDTLFTVLSILDSDDETKELISECQVNVFDGLPTSGIKYEDTSKHISYWNCYRPAIIRNWWINDDKKLTISYSFIKDQNWNLNTTIFKRSQHDFEISPGSCMFLLRSLYDHILQKIRGN